MRIEPRTDFSVLICHLPERKPLLDRLTGTLEEQIRDAYGQLGFRASIHICPEPRPVTVAAKRNALLDMAKGQYVAFVDDDDMVPKNYVASIAKALRTKPDVVGIHGILRHLTGPQVLSTGSVIAWKEPAHIRLDEHFYHSLRYQVWSDMPAMPPTPGKTYYRNPNHLNPVRIELARQVRFPEIGLDPTSGRPIANHGEDHDYSKRLLPLLKTEIVIDEPMYFYLTR